MYLFGLLFFVVVSLLRDKEIERKTTKFSPLGRTPLSSHGFLIKHSSALLLFPYSAFCHHQFLKTLTQVVISTKIVGFINLLFIYLFIFLILSIYLPMYLSASLPIYQSMYLLISQAFLSIDLSLGQFNPYMVYLLTSVST